MQVRKVTTEEERNDAFRIRTIVFVEEQKVPVDEELDHHDETAIHFVGYENDQPVAASRLRFENDYGKLERICVLPEYRGKHFGQQIVEEMEREIAKNGYKKAKLNAQTHAEEFYKRIGYSTADSGIFMDAGIPHVTMTKTFT